MLHPLHPAKREGFRVHVRVLQLLPVVTDVDQFSADVIGLLRGEEERELELFFGRDATGAADLERVLGFLPAGFVARARRKST